MRTTILPVFAIRALFVFLFAIPITFVSTAQTCSISFIRFSNLSSININNTADNTSDDYYTADVTVSFANAPATGSLRLQQAGAVLDIVTVPVGSLSGGTHTFTATRLRADGAVNQVTAEFTSQLTCAVSKPAPVIRINTIIAGGSPFQDSLWTWNASNYSIISRFGPTMPGFTITGLNGFATHPITGVIYTILKVSGVSGRVLATIDLQTGVCAFVGNLGDNFSSITFAPDGTLYGVTGDGATVPETVYAINIATAAKTLFKTLGNGADGEVILYNPDNSLIYHWSGNGSVVWETFDPAAPVNPPAGLTFSGTAGGETFGALYLGNGKILVSNISSQFKEWDINTGAIGPALTSTPDDIRGLVRKHCSSVMSADGTTTICAGGSVTLSIVGGGTNYQWRRNGADIGGANSSGYLATTAGLYNCVFTDACGYTDSFSVGTEVTIIAPDVNTVFNQVVCNGALTNAITFTGSVPGTTFNWTNNNTSIGLAASGSDDIAAFTAINAGIPPVSATITVTPNLVCNGPSKMFTITVNNPQVASTTPGSTCAEYWA